VNQNTLVTALGVYDFGAAGGGEWATDHEVGLWTDSGTLLDEVTVTSSDPESQDSGGNEIRWVTLSTPLDLSAGLTYDIAAYYPTSSRYMDPVGILDNSVTTDSAITYGQSLGAEDDEAFTFPETPGEYSPSYFGPNFQIESAPEPSMLALFGISIITLLGLQRQRAQRKA
jgi:hypothetical protein